MNIQLTFFIRIIFIINCLFYPFISLNYYSNAHMRGIFSTKEEALKKSLTIGCNGIHKNKDKWLPCANEKELHKYLRK